MGEVWNLHIGGCQVIDKYLKSRNGRSLSLDEIGHISKVEDPLAFTIAQMRPLFLYCFQRVQSAMSQHDFFQAPLQNDLFSGEKRQESYAADPQRVRERLHRIIVEARSAESLPWDAQLLRYLQTVVPQMSLWLPNEEAAQLRFEFDEEVKRLELLSAA